MFNVREEKEKEEGNGKDKGKENKKRKGKGNGEREEREKRWKREKKQKKEEQSEKTLKTDTEIQLAPSAGSAFCKETSPPSRPVGFSAFSFLSGQPRNCCQPGNSIPQILGMDDSAYM